jgi:isopentenyl-diphosphate Delta-isomerase
MQDYVIVVNASDEEVGREEKMQAHRTPVLHRAFSVFVLDERGAMLVQRRADGKYHSAGLWSNACCGHPRPGEQVIAAAERRLREEMGIGCTLVAAGTVSYSIEVGDGLREDEFNHVLFGTFAGDVRPDPAEVSGWQWMTAAAVHDALRNAPHTFTPWFGVVLERLRAWLASHPAEVPAGARRAWHTP